MFDDFNPSATTQQSRARFRNSMAAAMVFYTASTAGIVAATNRVIKVVEEKETKVEFAPPPEPPPPPPPPPPPVQAAAPPPPSARPKMKRPELAPPKEISDEKLKESNKELVAAGETGPVEGFLTGTIGGTGTKAAPPPPPPPPKLEPLIPPVPPTVSKPRYPAAARRRGIEGTVQVEFDILEDGRVANPKILSGPAELQETVLSYIVTWHFKPASRGGKPVRYRMKKSITFRLDDE